MDTSILPVLTFLGFACWLYGLLVILVVIMQLVKVDFYNPIAQWIAKLTFPVLVPLRRIVPHYQRLDVAALILAIVLNGLVIGIYLYKSPDTAIDSQSFISSALLLTSQLIAGNLLDIFTVTLVGHAVMSWFGEKAYYSPIGRLFGTINEPLVGPIRNAIMGKGGIGGLDFSPMIVILGIFLIRSVADIPFMVGLQVVSS